MRDQVSKMAPPRTWTGRNTVLPFAHHAPHMFDSASVLCVSESRSETWEVDECHQSFPSSSANRFHPHEP
jgi:hypothetical protein